MTFALRVTVAVFCVLFAGYAVHLIRQGRLLLRYSLLWFAFALVTLFCALYPDPVFAVSAALGFKTASNFVLFLGLLLALAIVLGLSVAVSRLTRSVTRLVQENAILRNRLDSLQDAQMGDGDDSFGGNR